MDRFRVIAVIDIKDGLAVHAIKGQRESYAPVQCSWCANGSVQAMIDGYSNVFGFNDMYVADLGAILGDAPDPAVHALLLGWRDRSDGALMIDAGVTGESSFDALVAFGHDTIILGTESIASPVVLESLLARKSANVIISIDVKDGRVLSPVDEWRHLSPPDLVERLAEHEPEAFIYLNLSRVGSKEGIDPVAVAAARRTTIPVLLGGGIRSTADIEAARDVDLGGVLVATALLDGSIVPGDLARFKEKK